MVPVSGPAGRAWPAPEPAFRPDRVYLGWQHALICPPPGRQPARPPPAVPDQVSTAWLTAQRREEDRLARPRKITCAWAVVAGCVLTGCWLAGFISTGLVVLGGGASAAAVAAALGMIWYGERDLRTRVTAEYHRVAAFRAFTQRQHARRQAEHTRQVRAWRQRSVAFRHQPQWYPVWLPGGVHRVDVAGGTLAGWSALLTSVAAPRLAAGDEVTVLDLTEGAVAGDLLGLARACGIDPLVWVLPADLPRLDLGTGLPPEALAEVLARTAQAGCGGDLPGDAALLHRVMGVTGTGIGPLLAGLRVLAEAGDTRADIDAGLLTESLAAQLGRLPGRGQPAVAGRARAIEARLRELDGLGSRPASLPPARLRLAWLDRRASAPGELALASYLAAALTRLLHTAPAGRPWSRTVFVLGAERLPADILDPLTAACEACRAGLVLAYRSIPEGDRLGRGGAAVAFMRPGSARDARAAAERIGTGHRFVISQFTQTVGTSVAAGDSYASTAATAGPPGRAAPRAAPASLTEGISSSTAWGWSTAQAISANESLARASQRSAEFGAGQDELRRLPASAVLLSYAGPGGRRVVLADANPAILGLPSATLVSLDES